MKTLISILFFVAGLCFLVSCSKDEVAVSPGDELQSDALVCGKVFKVQPAKGADITDELNQAFDDAKAAGPGSVVQLPEGEFELGFIEVHEFYGSFVGAGKGKTVITAKTGLDCKKIIGPDRYGWLISFVGGDICISDMTLKFPQGESVCKEGEWTDCLLFADYTAYYQSINNYINAYVNNVEFLGEYNCWNALAAGNDTRITGFPRSHVDMKVTNCTFDAFGWGLQMIGIKEGKFILGTKHNGNTFTNCRTSIVFRNNINASFEVVENKFLVPLKGWGLDMDNRPWHWVDESQTKTSSYTIEGNEFDMVGGDIGLWMHDHRLITNPGENLPVLFKVKNNQFNMNDGTDGTNIYESGAGMYFTEVKGPVILNNKFIGNSIVGIYVSPFETAYAEDGLILGNNLSRTTCSYTYIFLNELVKGWTVVGNTYKNVINLGTNNNITGMKVKTSSIPMGQTISDRLRYMKEKLSQ
ncbi:MAG: hypothetical protein LLG13_12565 [Bacteroidales bacterium]|nr:hypothetical protein [Bacteroidales bacterium]